MSTTWTKQKLGGIFKLKYGKGLVFDKRIPGTFPVYGSSGFVGTHKEYLVEGPGIIVGRKGSVGEVYFSENNFYPIDTVYYIPKDDSRYNIKYLYYFLKHTDLKKLQGDVGVPGLNREAVYSEDVLFLSDKTSQSNIALLLSTYDDLIENNKKRIKALEETAQLLYTEWFVKFKFPLARRSRGEGGGHEKGKMIESGTEYGKIPEGWEVEKLGEKILVKKGKNITRKTIFSGDIPVVAGGLGPAYFHNISNTKSPVITISASGANAGFTRLYFEDIWASDCSFIDLSVTPYVYFYYLFFSKRQADIFRLQRGSAQPHVYPKDLMNMRSVFASNEVIKKFNDRVTPLFELIRSIKKSNLVLSKTRDFLIPQLVTGKRALKI